MFTTILNLFCYIPYYVYDITSFIFSVLHTVLPMGMDIGLIGVAAYYLTKLQKPNPANVEKIFGVDPWSEESKERPEDVVTCIAHRGAGLDAPENTMEAFKYCVDNNCRFIELDVRMSRDGRLVLLHDEGLERLTMDSNITDLRIMDWDMIKNIDIAATHPNKSKFKAVHLCLLDTAIDYLLENKVRMIIDIKGQDPKLVEGILKWFKDKPQLYSSAAVTCFNPWVLYQIRKKDPQIVGAMSYRPYCFSFQEYDAQSGANKKRFPDNMLIQWLLRVADLAHAASWRGAARWCSVSAVLLHKDIVSVSEMHYWRSLGVRCCGWCVNRPLEKLYWRGVLRAPYLANTLLGEPELLVEQKNLERLDEGSVDKEEKTSTQKFQDISPQHSDNIIKEKT